MLLRRSRIRGTLVEWASEALRESGHKPAEHHRLLAAELEDLSNGPHDRLMVLMPPGSAKSTYASVIYPTWWFTQHPGSSIIAASHSFSLAEHFSRRARALVAAKQGFLGFSLSKENRSTNAWRTTTGGEYLALGVRGAISGRRADLVIIDDPIKSQADAESPRQRAYIWDWFKSDITTRIKPGGKILLVMTRWHPDDLGGHLLSQAPTEWRVLRLPALAEQNDDPLGRSIGAPLWPAWEDRAALLRKRDLIGERAWSALYQQTPMPAGGRLFATERIITSGALAGQPAARIVRGWDLAATVPTGKGEPDWTVGVKLSRDNLGRYTIIDVVRIQGTPHQVEELIVKTAANDGRSVVVSIPEDPGQAGKSQISYLTRQLAGFHVNSSRESGSKATRAMPLASQMEAGNISMIRGDWNTKFIEEFHDFPWGPKDDQVDACVRAFTVLADKPRESSVFPMRVFDR